MIVSIQILTHDKLKIKFTGELEYTKEEERVITCNICGIETKDINERIICITDKYVNPEMYDMDITRSISLNLGSFTYQIKYVKKRNRIKLGQVYHRFCDHIEEIMHELIKLSYENGYMLISSQENTLRHDRSPKTIMIFQKM